MATIAIGYPDQGCRFCRLATLRYVEVPAKCGVSARHAVRTMGDAMKSPTSRLERSIEPRILVLRGARVILDAQLAELYGVDTKHLNQAIKRNPARFPADFAFQLTAAEVAILRSQIVTSRWLEADLLARRAGHELPQGVEDDLELRVVSLLQLVQPADQVLAGAHHPPQADEDPHDLDVDLHGPLAAQDARQHRHSLLAEGVGKIPPAASI